VQLSSREEREEPEVLTPGLAVDRLLAPNGRRRGCRDRSA